MRIGQEGWLGDAEEWALASSILQIGETRGQPLFWRHSSWNHTPFAFVQDWRDGRVRPSPHRLGEFSHPDVAKAQGLALVAVGLEFDGGAVEFLVERLTDIACLAFQFEVIVD